jgi:predicted metal-dependent enzyme (double-stranded beta helix superfamily)
MFDTDTLIAECRQALAETDPRRAVREVIVRALEKPEPVAAALGRTTAGIEILHSSPELTVSNVIWAPEMSIYPHDHRMWAVIGIYGGAEDNTLYKRGPERITPAGGRSLRDRDVLALGAEAIHAVTNPQRRYTGAIHVYGGDFVNQPRSQWDPDTLIEKPYDLEQVRRLFAVANAEWAAQVGTDVDEAVHD